MPVDRSAERSILVQRQVRARLAKVTLPTIGTRAITPSPNIDERGDTDGRGGDVPKGDTPAAALTAPPTGQPITPIEDLKPADQQSTEASPRKTQHAARERPAKVHKHRTVRKKRERPSMYASGYRNRSLLSSVHAICGGF